GSVHKDCIRTRGGLLARTGRAIGLEWQEGSLPSNHVQRVVLRNSERRTMQAVQRHTAAQGRGSSAKSADPYWTSAQRYSIATFLTFDVPALVEAPMECCHRIGGLARRPAAEKPNHRHRRLLPASRERPRGCRAAEQRDEPASPHGAHPTGLDW